MKSQDEIIDYGSPQEVITEISNTDIPAYDPGVIVIPPPPSLGPVYATPTPEPVIMNPPITVSDPIKAPPVYNPYDTAYNPFPNIPHHLPITPTMPPEPDPMPGPANTGNDQQPEAGGPTGNIMDWIKNNPLIAAGLGVGLYFLLFSKKRKRSYAK